MQEAPSQDRAPILVRPPLVFLGCFVVAGVLQMLVPLGFAAQAWQLRSAGGGVLFALSGLFAGWSFVVMRRNETPVEPSRPTVFLVRDGPFRVSRNPLYLSLVLAFSGIGLAFGSWWFAVFLPVVWALLHFGAVLPEERYLEQKFGEDYRSYKERVRRWL